VVFCQRRLFFTKQKALRKIITNGERKNNDVTSPPFKCLPIDAGGLNNDTAAPLKNGIQNGFKNACTKAKQFLCLYPPINTVLYEATKADSPYTYT